MHLKQTYGFINPTQLAENYNKMTAPINFQGPIETLFEQIEDGVRYANAVMQPYMEALLSCSFSTLAPSLMPVESGNAVLQSTKLGLTSGANLQEPNGNSASSQALQAAQIITLSMLQSTMYQYTTHFLLMVDL
jgi:hypothetical protein